MRAPEDGSNGAEATTTAAGGTDGGLIGGESATACRASRRGRNVSATKDTPKVSSDAPGVKEAAEASASTAPEPKANGRKARSKSKRRHKTISTEEASSDIPHYVQAPELQHDAELPSFHVGKDKHYTTEERILRYEASLPEWIRQPITIKPDVDPSSSNLGLVPLIRKNLRNVGVESWNPIQQLVIPRLLQPASPFRIGFRDCFISAPTGSGKSFCYIAPILQNLLYRQEQALRAIILVPTKTLVTQVESMTNQVAEETGLVIASMVERRKFAKEPWLDHVLGTFVKTSLTGEAKEHPPRPSETLLEHDFEDALELLRTRAYFREPAPADPVLPDILIATPQGLGKYLEEGLLDLSHLMYLVIDEADNILNHEENELPLSQIMRHLEPQNVATESSQTTVPKSLQATDAVCGGGHYRESKIQKILVTATSPRYPDKLTVLNLRRPVHYAMVDPALLENASKRKFVLPETLKVWHYAIDGPMDKIRLTYLLLKQYDRMLCFTTTATEARKLAAMLSEMLSIGRSPKVVRNMCRRAEEAGQTLKEFKDGKINMIIATRAVSRGVDFADLPLVINYAPPENREDLVHRAGRTARAGKQGECITLVADMDRYQSMLKGLSEPHQYPVFSEEALQKATSIMNAAIKRLSK